MRLRLHGRHQGARLRLCALLAFLSLVCTAMLSAEMQECDPVSFHPEGKIVCRPLVPSAKPSAPPPPIQYETSEALQHIEQLIAKYGKDPIIAAIRAKKEGHITLAVGNALRDYYGAPNASYVTPETIRRDLEDLHLAPTTFEEYVQRAAARVEQKRQAAAQQAAEFPLAQARERLETEAVEKRQRVAEGKMKAEQEQEQRQKNIDELVKYYLRQSPPPDYKERLDAAFVRILKDPDSRKIEYGLPQGSAICGTVNARNSYGGYTGRQVFLSYFDARGKMEELKIYKDDDLLFKKYDTGIEGQLLKACGFFK